MGFAALPVAKPIPVWVLLIDIISNIGRFFQEEIQFFVD
jgi:hypothetical protein